MTKFTYIPAPRVHLPLSTRDNIFFSDSAKLLNQTNMTTTTPDDHDAGEERSEELAQPVLPELAASLPDSDMAEVDNVEPRPTTVEEEEKAPEPPQKSSSPQSETPKKKLCGVCDEKEYKYKCSRCYLP